MKRIELLGLALLALLAVLAMGAITAAGAMAETPEILPLPTEGKPLTYTSETTTEPFLETTAGGEKNKIKCAKAKSAGSFTSANAGKVTIEFSGCKVGTKNCTTKGDALGEVLLINAPARLVDVLPGGVLDLGLLVTINNLELECGTLKEKVTGSMIGAIDNEKGELLKSLEAFKNVIGLWKGTKGEQAITECMFPESVCSGKAFKLEAELGVGLELAVLLFDASFKFTTSNEVHF
jgi:hypothetical protein